jgi:hypothetical protein
MSSLAVKPDSQLAQSFDVLREWADRVISELPALPDERIVEICRQAAELERQAFRIRGEGALVIRDRVARRLKGGRGVRDEQGVGLRAQLQKFASEVGVDVSTVETDARIVETFGREETFGVDAETLGREYFREALSAPDPRQAITLARRKLESDTRYSVRQFRDDVRAMREADARDEPRPDLEEIFWYRVGLDSAGQSDLRRIQRAFRCDPAEALRRAVVETAKTLKE